MKPRRNSIRPQEPAPGGDSFGVADAGEPVYKTPLPPVRTVLRRGPNGKMDIVAGGRVATTEGQLLAADPLVPTAAELRRLPRRAGLAFAARCARRVWPLTQAVGLPVAVVRAVEAALGAVDQYTTGSADAGRAAESAHDAMQKATLTCRIEGEAGAAVVATWDLYRAALDYPDLQLNLGLPVHHAARALMLAATLSTPLTLQIRRIRRDFDRLARLAKDQTWADDTPVPADVFGPLWPRKLTPPWAAAPPA